VIAGFGFLREWTAGSKPFLGRLEGFGTSAKKRTELFPSFELFSSLMLASIVCGGLP
jgi:hypothetical protein